MSALAITASGRASAALMTVFALFALDSAALRQQGGPGWDWRGTDGRGLAQADEAIVTLCYSPTTEEVVLLGTLLLLPSLAAVC